MEKPLTFILENNGQLELNKELLNIIEKSRNPRLLLFYGATRQGKSTTLNQIIRGNINTWKYINKWPFKSQTSQNRITFGCDIFGPIRCSEILKRHCLQIDLNEDFDIFFCDTEGLFSLNGQSKELIPGILTLLQICTFSVIMINSVPDVNTISQITSEIQFSKLLQQINRELKSPLVSIYISGYQVDILEKKNFEDCLEEYQKQKIQTTDLIFKNIKKYYPHLHITENDFKVIPGGPYEHNNADEPNHKNINAKLYWYSINSIVKEFALYSNNTSSHSAIKLISLMRVVFGLFKDFKELPNNPNLTNVLIKYLIYLFNQFSQQQFEKISLEIKDDLKNNYDKYYRMLYDDNLAKEKLNKCIEENLIEVYKVFIPDKIKSFMEKAILKLRNSIENQFEKEFEIKCKEILSNDYINHLIIDIKKEINKAYFREDINMSIINNYSYIWNMVEKKNEKLFKYFKSKKPKNIEILKNYFENSIKTIINSLISQKMVWEQFYEEIKRKIENKINMQYLELYSKIQYQEEFNKLKNNAQLSKELFEKYNEKYFKNLPYDKKNIIKKWIEKTCEKEYNKLKEDNKSKPKWENIKINMKIIIQQILNQYIFNIFNGKNFRNEIDHNLGRKDNILSIIPKEIIQNPEIPQNKLQEINNMIFHEIQKAVDLFNQKIQNLPSLEQVLYDKEKLCNQIADAKINQLMSQFFYSEDKIPFNSDNFFNLLWNNEKIHLNLPQNNPKIYNMIKRVSQNKAHEYNNILVPQLPKWSGIKEIIILKIKNKCDEFYKRVFKNKNYKEEVKYDMNELENSIKSLNLFEGILPYKYNEIKDLISKMKEKTENNIKNKTNNLSSWLEKKLNLIQNGYLIMLQKSNTDLKTKNYNQIANILLKEVINTPGFLAPCKNSKQTTEIIEELTTKANQIANIYISKKNEEEKKNKEFQEILNEQIQLLKEQEERAEKEKEEKEAKEKAEKERLESERIENEKKELENQYFPKTPYEGVSIVDGLEAIGIDSSYNYRCSIAEKNGIQGYVGSPEQNTQMLNLLKQGKLLKP